LDISTLAAIASGHFASSHERLGRNRPENGLREVHLNNEFFSKVVGSKGTLIGWKPLKVGIMAVEFTKFNSETAALVSCIFMLWYRSG